MQSETLRMRNEAAVLFADGPTHESPGARAGPRSGFAHPASRGQRGLQGARVKSADPDYVIALVDVTRIKEYRAEAAKLTGEASIALLFRRLSASRLVSIAQIEARRDARAAVRAA